MKKITLSVLFFGATLSVSADVSVIYEDDFNSLIPFTTTVITTETSTKTVYDAIGTNDCTADCLNITETTADGKTAFEAMTEKGYQFLRKNPTGSAASKTPQTSFYLQKTVENGETTGAYLRIGVTGGASGLVLPPLKDLPENGVSDVTVTFQWCPVRQGSGTYDYTHLSVTVTPEGGKEITTEGNGRENVEETNYGKTEDLSFPKNSALAWHDATLNFGDYVFKNGDVITIRPGANQFPMNKSYTGVATNSEPAKGTCRYFLRNIKVTTTNNISTSVTEFLASDENAPIEYFNLQGMKVAEPENGLYIVRQGNKVSKKFIRK